MTPDDASAGVAAVQSRARALRVPLLFAVTAAAALAWLIATHTDITVWQDVRRDVMVRDSYSLDEIADIRFFDTSPFTIWLPSDLQVRQSIRSGTLPFWDRGQAGGYSPLLNSQNGAMHPARWLMALVPRDATPTALLVLELFLLATGGFLFLRDGLSLSDSASALGACALAFSGHTLSVAFFSGANLPLLHVPWLAWAYFKWVDTRRRAYVVAFILIAALLILSGHALLIATSMLAVAMVIVCDCAARRAWRDLLMTAAMTAVAAALTAFATLPMLTYLRSIWTYKLQSSHGFPYQPLNSGAFWEALTWIVAYHHDPADKFDGGSLAYFIGAGVAVLALIGLVAAARSRRAAFVVALAVAGLLLAVPPPWMALARETPVRFFKPWYLMFILTFGLVSAAAIGFDGILETIPRRWRLAAGLVLATLVLAPLVQPVKDVFVPMRMRNIRSDPIEFIRADREIARTTGFQGQTHGPNASSITGIEDLRFSSPLIPIRYRTWFAIADPIAVEKSFPTTIVPTSAATPLFGAFNVRYIFLSRDPVLFCHTFLPRPGERPHSKYFLETPPAPGTHPLVRQSRSISIYRNDLNFHQRAHFARAVSVVTGGLDADAAELRRLGGELGETEVLESRGSIDPATIASWTRPSADDTVSVAYPSDRDVMIKTRSRSPRLLVLHDSYEPGWRATVDGDRVEVMPVSLISRGVVVPAGTHVVAMRFTPVGMATGCAISVAAAALGLFALRRAGQKSGALVP